MNSVFLWAAQAMRRYGGPALLVGACWAGGSAAQAGALLYSGEFNRDDALQRFDFELSSAASLSVRSLSFQGGWAGGQWVNGGGFAPVLALFDGAGWLSQLDLGSSRACPPDAGANGLCWDSELNLLLQPGRYWLMLSQDGNTPLGPHFDDGYARQGEADYSGWDALGQGGLRFINADGQQRDGHWALVVDGVRFAVPEPASGALLPLALALLAAQTRRRPSTSDRKRVPA